MDGEIDTKKDRLNMQALVENIKNKKAQFLIQKILPQKNEKFRLPLSK